MADDMMASTEAPTWIELAVGTAGLSSPSHFWDSLVCCPDNLFT